MLEQEFENLLAAYFEEELDEAGLTRLREAIRQTPARRRRFQRELRLHTLMREAGTVLAAKEQSPSTIQRLVVWFQQRRVAACAACLAICGLGLLAAWNQWERPERIGRCVRVSEGGELMLLRLGRQVPLRQNTVLRAGDRIQTGCEAEVVLRVDGAGTLTLQGLNTLDLFAPSEEVGLAIQQGRMLIGAEKRTPGTPPLVIRTPQSSVRVLGTVLGLEVEPTATRVRVYEGKVGFEQTTSGEAVQIGPGEYSVTGSPKLEVLDQRNLSPDALLPGQQRLRPVADAYQDGTRLMADRFLKVQGERRTAFLKFTVRKAGQVLAARLRMTQMVDSGGGTLRFWEGSHNDWSEETLSPANMPGPLRQVGRRVGWVALGQTVEVDISSLIHQDGTYTLVVTLDETEGNDIWFGSRESPTPPELILTCQP
jgi:ferric-dicitrate binding protein FerR (iron transport regulator)